MANYKTPNVYVEEIATFPPSVAAVATAIPAFIGYTEVDDLKLVPTRISSLLDYQAKFGNPYPQKGIEVEVDGNTITQINGLNGTPTFQMYYALQMYFANGGGPCYIVSVGTADENTLMSVTDFEDGLAAIEKEDEPTMLLFPDATNLSLPANYYSVINSSLAQSKKLQDRFTIVDTYTDAAIGSSNDPILELRNLLINDETHRKYGAAYYPYLKTIIDYFFIDGEVAVLLENQDYTSQFPTLIQQLITNGANVSLTANLATLLSTYNGLSGTPTDPLTPSERQKCIDDLKAVKASLENYVSAFETINAIGVNLQGLLLSPDTSLDNAVDALATWIETELTDNIATLEASIVLFETSITYEDAEEELNGTVFPIFDYTAGSFEFIQNVIDSCLDDEVADLEQAVNDVQTAGIETNLEGVKAENNLLYNQIKQAIADTPMLLPPSSSIAGVYARVDNSLGVWRAPANVGLNYVLQPSQVISNLTQEDMNVTTTGKSVNAIRSFVGKGTLVWGARTLDGNSNEWRFINVRRFFNFAEESIKKATEPFVFQSNDANTWVSIRSMISSFLTLQWKAGALTGASTEQAFYVKVGLGSTMTPEDILSGTMIIEVGMAVVRPAEFIVLKFTHKMQEI